MAAVTAPLELVVRHPSAIPGQVLTHLGFDLGQNGGRCRGARRRRESCLDLGQTSDQLATPWPSGTSGLRLDREQVAPRRLDHSAEVGQLVGDPGAETIEHPVDVPGQRG